MQRLEMERVRAVERFRAGEDVDAICASLGRSKRWLYKWVTRAEAGGDQWFEERSRRPQQSPHRTPTEMAAVIIAAREELEREGLFSGAQAIQWELAERNIAVPSIATVNRILKAAGAFEKAPERYTSKRRRYPAPVAKLPNDVHQNDFVGPRYLFKGTRFYSLNTTDVTTARAAAIPLRDRASESVIRAIWTTWLRLGQPRFFQVDNELVFWGSRRHPGGLGQVLRLCLHEGVQPVFIPPREPWRNGVIEKCNDHWQQKFLRRAEFTDFEHLTRAAKAFDEKRNSRWRYAKNGGKSPNDALRYATTDLIFPAASAPRLPISKPTTGRLHLIRFIRSDCLLDIFGERFELPATASYEYVTATIDVGAQELQVTLDDQPLAAFKFVTR